MNEFIMFVGLPGSGKSTIRDSFVNTLKNQVYIYSTDDFIENIAQKLNKTYSDIFEDYIKNATTECNSGLDRAAKHSNDIIWDQTNLSAKKRKYALSKIPTDYKKICVCFIPPRDVDEESELWYRLENRAGKLIPENVIKNMWDNYKLPSYEEGFDEIIYYDIYGNVVENVTENSGIIQ